jgi:MscS family membrane protein
MHHRLRRFIIVATVCALPALALTQIPGLTKQSASPAAGTPADPLGRSTPRGTIVEFTRAVDRDDFVTATLYLQLDPCRSNRLPF